MSSRASGVSTKTQGVASVGAGAIGARAPLLLSEYVDRRFREGMRPGGSVRTSAGRRVTGGGGRNGRWSCRRGRRRNPAAVSRRTRTSRRVGLLLALCWRRGLPTPATLGAARRGRAGVPARARDVRLRELVVHGVEVIVDDRDDGLAQVVVVVASRRQVRIGGARAGAGHPHGLEQRAAPGAQLLHLGRERREVVAEEVLCAMEAVGGFEI